jgi:hypothetical protein
LFLKILKNLKQYQDEANSSLEVRFSEGRGEVKGKIRSPCRNPTKRYKGPDIGEVGAGTPYAII